MAGFTDYQKFWSELEKNIDEGELVNSFNNPEKYNDFQAEVLDWFDTGNLDDLEKAKLYFRDKPLSLSKENNEFVYKEDTKFIKFISHPGRLKNLYNRGLFLDKLIPNNLSVTDSFLYYDWVEGDTLYNIDKIEIYKKFIDDYLDSVELVPGNKKDNNYFYKDKTFDRIKKFKDIYGNRYTEESFIINEVRYDSLDNLIKEIDFKIFENHKFTNNFHGDLQFDNILYSSSKFYYVDWRDSFGKSIEAGDIYYDLSKLYGGMIIPYNMMKDENNIYFSENSLAVNFEIVKNQKLDQIVNYYFKLLSNTEFEISKIKLISSLIYLNMAPLHEEKFGKFLWFNAISKLSDLIDK